MNWKNVGNTLRRLRRKTYPACASVPRFIDLLENDDNVKRLFCNFRDEPFYRGSFIFSDGAHMSVFLVDQMLDEIQPGCKIAFDGTFSILPLHYKQLFVILAEINGE